MTERADYLSQLTWLRGIAAFFVVISHVTRSTEVSYSPLDEPSFSTLFSVFDLGSFGVVLFFVLSGCTLYISNGEKICSKNIIGFYLKRVFRIWPAFVVSLAIYILFGVFFREYYGETHGHWVEKQFLTLFSATDLISYITLFFNINGPSGLFNNAFWSLPVEFQYYLIFPILIISLRYTNILGPIAISLLLYALPKFGIIEFEENEVFRLAFTFSGGIIVGYLYSNYSFRLTNLHGYLLILALFSLASAISNSLITLPNIPILSGKWNWFGIISICTVYIVLITEIKLPNNIAFFLKSYGTISYSTYLYHNLYIGISVLLIINLELNDSLIRLLLVSIFTFTLTHMTAKLSYKYGEKPFIKFGHSLTKI